MNHPSSSNSSALLAQLCSQYLHLKFDYDRLLTEYSKLAKQNHRLENELRQVKTQFEKGRKLAKKAKIETDKLVSRLNNITSIPTIHQNNNAGMEFDENNNNNNNGYSDGEENSEGNSRNNDEEDSYIENSFMENDENSSNNNNITHSNNNSSNSNNLNTTNPSSTNNTTPHHSRLSSIIDYNNSELNMNFLTPIQSQQQYDQSIQLTIPIKPQQLNSSQNNQNNNHNNSTLNANPNSNSISSNSTGTAILPLSSINPNSLLHANSSSSLYNSIIECGFLNNSGIRIYSCYIEYFHKEVDVFIATNDPQRRFLFKVSQLAEKLNCNTNRIGMHLLRHKNHAATNININEENNINNNSNSLGFFQATEFRFKPEKSHGLKAGAYFLSEQACRTFQPCLI